MTDYAIKVWVSKSGLAIYTVEAESESDARRKHNNGESDFESEELAITEAIVKEIEEI